MVECELSKVEGGRRNKMEETSIFAVGQYSIIVLQQIGLRRKQLPFKAKTIRKGAWNCQIWIIVTP